MALGIITCTAITVSCNDDDDYYTPGSSIVEIFDDYYPDATNVRWYYVGGYYVADFDYYGDDMESFHSERKLVQFALPMLDELIKIAAREEVDLVVNLGDIIQDTSSKDLDIESLAFMFRQTHLLLINN